MSIQEKLTSPNIEQSFLLFACRTATHKDLSNTEKNSLQIILEEANYGNTPRIDENTQKGLFQTISEYPIGPMTVTAPSFAMNNNSLTIFKPIRMGEQVIGDSSQLETQQMRAINTSMAGIINNIQSVVSNLTIHRAGKIYEFTIKCSPDNKQRLAKIFSYPLANTNEINLSLTNQHDDSGELYNQLTQIAYSQPMNLTDPFILKVKVDINNRHLKSDMEAGEITRVWNKADSIIDSYLDSILDFPL